MANETDVIKLRIAANDALIVQDACNGRGVARSLVSALDAVAAVTAGTQAINEHPIVYLFVYKLMALNGHEPLGDDEAYRWATAQCERLSQVTDLNFVPEVQTIAEWRAFPGA